MTPARGKKRAVVAAPAQADTLMVAMNLAALHHERGEYGKAEVCA